MEKLADKLNLAAAPVLSRIDELRRNKDKAKQGENDQSIEIEQQGTSQSPVPIGFVIDPQLNQTRATIAGNWNTGSAFGGDTQPYSSPESGGQLSPEVGFDRSLQQGDAWALLWFQRTMVLTIIRMILFIRKIYEDYSATKLYGSNPNYLEQFLISLATLFLPTFIFTIYRVCRYLQLRLQSLREELKSVANMAESQAQSRPRQVTAHFQVVETTTLLNSPPSSPQPDADNYRSARETPVNSPSDTVETQVVDKSIQEETSSSLTAGQIINNPISRPVERPSSATVELRNVGYGSLSAKQTQIAIGTSQQFLHGSLYIFWQLKRQVDLIAYLVERSCLWRKPSGQEKQEVEQLQTGSDGLEWFQDVYAAFLAIVIQIYNLSFNWSQADPMNTRISAKTLNAAAPGINSLNSNLNSLKDQTVASVSNQVASWLSNPEKDTVIISQFAISLLVVFSLLVAVRRSDDGLITGALSALGWSSMFASRITLFALGYVYIKGGIMTAFIVAHVLAFTYWIYKIAIDSHNGEKHESANRLWNLDEDEDDPKPESDTNQSQTAETAAQPPSQPTTKTTCEWSALEHFVLLSQVFALFALPSLFYWPIMFNLRMNHRVLKYLVLILLENILLICTLWYALTYRRINGWSWYLLITVGVLSITAFLFVFLYDKAKPSLTEYFVLIDPNKNDTRIYFEFCTRVFGVPNLSSSGFELLTNQYKAEIEEQTIELT